MKTDYFSFELKVNYCEDENTEQAEKFISDICCQDEEYISYLKRFMGYCLTREVGERSFNICNGSGCNGKSTLFNIMNSILGSVLCCSLADKVVLKSKNSSDTSPELEALLHARVAVLPDIDDRQTLCEKNIKKISGGDRIYCNPKYRDPIEFFSKAKLVLVCNSKPKFNISDKAMLDRIVFMPFLAEFEKNSKNNTYCNELQTIYLNQFFKLFCQGAFEWYGGKELIPCEVMKREMKNYVSELDVVERWMNDACEKGDTDNKAFQMSGADAYREFINWRVVQNEEYLDPNTFGKILSIKVRKKKSNGIATYCGIRVKPQQKQQNDSNPLDVL